MSATAWTLEEAFSACRYIERKLRAEGWHVALTGSMLYGRIDPSKPPTGDLDLILYPDGAQSEMWAVEDLMAFMGVKKFRHLKDDDSDYPRAIVRAETKNGRRIDFFILADRETGTDSIETDEVTEPKKLHRRNAVDTSVQAAYAVDSKKWEAQVYWAIFGFGEKGCISEDLRALPQFEGLPYSTVTARYAALIERGYVIDTGERRPGKSGNKMRVMRAIPPPNEK